MKKKVIALTLATVAVLTSGMTAFAAEPVPVPTSVSVVSDITAEPTFLDYQSTNHPTAVVRKVYEVPAGTDIKLYYDATKRSIVLFSEAEGWTMMIPRTPGDDSYPPDCFIK